MMKEYYSRIYHRKKMLFFCETVLLLMIVLAIRLGILMLAESDYYGEQAIDVHERERDIKAARGRILDVNGIVLADNVTVCTISVIHSQIEDSEAVISMLCEELDLS